MLLSWSLAQKDTVPSAAGGGSSVALQQVTIDQARRAPRSRHSLSSICLPTAAEAAAAAAAAAVAVAAVVAAVLAVTVAVALVAAVIAVAVTVALALGAAGRAAEARRI